MNEPTLPQNVSVADIAKRLLLIDGASKSFLGFCQAIWPQFVFAPFHLELIDTLDRLEKGTLGKTCLLVTMPPRHGKSTITTVAFPAYYMLRQQSRKILSVSYGSDLAQNFGRQVRDLTLEKIIEQAFPDFELSPTSTAIDDWRTTDDGRYFACGVGGGTTGRPANLLLVDDPIKSRPEAESPAVRNKVWQFYNGSLVNRKEPELDGTPPIEILIQTRWHPDDLAGRIMNSDDWADGDWHHIDFPALTTKTREVKVLSKDGQTEETITETYEEALWPERFPVSMLEKMRRRDPRDFAALYQQQPFVAGGNMIKTQWFNTFTKDQIPDRFHTLIIAADTAFKTKEVNDPSVLITMALSHSGDIFILDVQRERLDYPSLKRKFVVQNSLWRGKGLRGIYIEDAASGQSILQDLRKEPGISVIPYRYPGGRATSDKNSRVSAILPLIEGGRVFIPEEAPWLDEFLEEMQAFGGKPKHDDQVDAMTIGLDVLSRVGITNNAGVMDFPDASTSLNAMSRLPSSIGPSLTRQSPDTDIRQSSSDWLNFKPLGEL